MFTGIVEEIGSVRAMDYSNQSIQLNIACKKIIEDIHIGDSISTNGVCLTVTGFNSCSFTVDVMPETLRKTSLAVLKPGSPVNVERALKADGRLGGHFVTGHIDGTGIIRQKSREGNAIWIDVEAPDEILKYIVHKGSVALDGTSLTVAVLHKNGFKVSLIPHTADVTILSMKDVGDVVNLECDILGKYIEKFVAKSAGTEKSGITMAFLAEHGF